MMPHTDVERSCTLGDRSIAYVLRVGGRSRRISLAVSRDGKVIVSVPKARDEAQALAFLRVKSVWIVKKLDHIAAHPPAQKPVTRSSEEMKALRHVTRELVLRRLAFFNQLYQLSFQRITVKDQKTRWGSCSKEGNLNFNYRLAILPLALADYVAVHELCHLQELNHSKRFWDLVGKALPDYEERRKILKRDWSCSI